MAWQLHLDRQGHPSVWLYILFVFLFQLAHSHIPKFATVRAEQNSSNRCIFSSIRLSTNSLIFFEEEKGGNLAELSPSLLCRSGWRRGLPNLVVRPGPRDPCPSTRQVNIGVCLRGGYTIPPHSIHRLIIIIIIIIIPVQMARNEGTYSIQPMFKQNPSHAFHHTIAAAM